MQIIDNLKLLFNKENRLYLIIVIWLLVGIVVIDFLEIIGIFIFIPYLAFLMFLYLLSLVSKKDIRKFSPLTLIGLLIISIPLMIIIIVVLFVLFAASLISYVFLTSWFIFYGLILTSKKVDDVLKQKKLKYFTRSIVFFGGVATAIILLLLFYISPTLDIYQIIFEKEVPTYLNYAYLVVGVAVLFLFGICFIFLFKKSFNAWYGLLSILIAGYTFYLVLKVFLGITGLESKSTTDITTEIGLLIADLLIIIYAISTLIGTKAELLARQLKYFGIDTVFIWLLFSKASYEFVENFPYELFTFSVNMGNTSYSLTPFNELIRFLNSDFINIAKNIAVLVFFILLVVIIGLWEIRKYNRSVFAPKIEEKTGIMKLSESEEPAIENNDNRMLEPQEELDIKNKNDQENGRATDED